VMVKEILEQVYPHLESSAIHPVVQQVFPLEEVEQAHELMKSGQHMGKIILSM
jgi:NADPH:quinone reductase-like Zn-dependent oxidoreductase